MVYLTHFSLTEFVQKYCILVEKTVIIYHLAFDGHDGPINLTLS